MFCFVNAPTPIGIQSNAACGTEYVPDGTDPVSIPGQR
jgi:hypothetical protein